MDSERPWRDRVRSGPPAWASARRSRGPGFVLPAALGLAQVLGSTAAQQRQPDVRILDWLGYALLLAGTNRVDEARRLFSEMLDEVSHLSSRERRYNRQWLQLAREELKKLSSYAVTG